MKALRWKVCLGALLVSATSAFAAPVPEPDFLLPVAMASKGGEAKKPEFSLSAWQNCVFHCVNGAVKTPQCNVPPATVQLCCEFSHNNMVNGCGANGGLASGYCTDPSTGVRTDCGPVE